MRACWLKWVGRDWSISADYIWLNYSDANMAEHMAKDHIFEDGNKRTSIVFALAVLRLAHAPVALSDSPEPKDNQYYAWIQDQVSGNRTREELADELRRNCTIHCQK